MVANTYGAAEVVAGRGLLRLSVEQRSVSLHGEDSCSADTTTTATTMLGSSFNYHAVSLE